MFAEPCRMEVNVPNVARVGTRERDRVVGRVVVAIETMMGQGSEVEQSALD